MKIKVSADYNGSGLWDDNGQLDLDKVAISQELKDLLAEWILTYVDILDWSNPMKDKPLSNEFITKLNALEDKVFEQVEKELGSEHELAFVSKKLPKNNVLDKK